MKLNSYPIVAAAFGLIFIEVLIRAFKVPAYYIPPPSAVFSEFFARWRLLFSNLAVTMAEALLGFLIGNVFAVIFGVIFAHVGIMKRAVYPVLVGFQAVPILAVAPFINIWFGSGMLSKVTMAALLCYFPATVITTDGLTSVNRSALLLLQSMGASRRVVFWTLRLPSAIPAVVSAFEVSATLCTVGAIVAEISGSSRGIGYLIVRSSYEFRTTLLFASLVAVSFATWLLFKSVQLLGDLISRRYRFAYA